MEREELLDLAQRAETTADGADIFVDTIAKMNNEELVKTFDDLSSENSAAVRSTDSFQDSYKLLFEEIRERIMRQGSDIENMDMAQLSDFTALLGNLMNDNSGMAGVENISSLREAVKRRKQQLESTEELPDIVISEDMDSAEEIVIEQEDVQTSQPQIVEQADNITRQEEPQTVEEYLREQYLLQNEGMAVSDQTWKTPEYAAWRDNYLSTHGNDEKMTELQKSDYIRDLEAEYGLDDEHLQSPETLERNFRDLEEMRDIGDENIFAPDLPREEKETPMSAPQEYKKSIDRIKSGKYSVADLVGAQKYCLASFSEEAQKFKQSGIDIAGVTADDWSLVKHAVRDTLSAQKKITPNEFADYRYLLDNYQPLIPNSREEDKNLAAARAHLEKQQSAQYAKYPLKDPEFQDIRNVLQGLKIRSGFHPFKRDKVSREDDINLFLEQVRRQTELKLATSSQAPIAPEKFKQAYADELRAGLLQLISADTLAKGAGKAHIENAIANIAGVMGKGGTVVISRDSLIGWQAGKQARIETAVERLGEKGRTTVEKEKYKALVQSPKIGFFGKIKALDKKLTEKYGQKYTTAKNLVSGFAWGAAYGAVHTNPVAFAAVATARLSLSMYKTAKDFRQQKNEAAAKGQKLTLRTMPKLTNWPWPAWLLPHSAAHSAGLVSVWMQKPHKPGQIY